MEPWQAEQMRLRELERRSSIQCVCCREQVRTERFLDLSDFGLREVACERCVENNMHWRFS